MIEETLKDYKPFGPQWVNHKDPDIYESELNLSNTSDAENKKTKDRESQFFMQKVVKKPSKMRDNEDYQQDYDLQQVEKRPQGKHEVYMDETVMEFSPSLGERISQV